MHTGISGLVTFFHTGDMALVRAFYENLLSLPLFMDRGGYRLYDAGGAGKLGFGETEDFRPTEDVLISFILPTREAVDQLCTVIRDAGLPILQEPVDKDLYGIYNFFARDTEGRRVEFMFFTGLRQPVEGAGASVVFRTGTAADLVALYPEYLETFPAEERKPLPHLLRLLSQGTYKLCLACESQTGKRLGYALVFEIPALRLRWLDFLAVTPGIRSRGTGAALFRHLAEEAPEKWDGLLLEVEMPDGTDALRQRRIGFYERLGARRLPVAYRLPAPDGGYPMFLYYRPGASDRLTKPTLCEAVALALRFIHADRPETEAVLQRFNEEMMGCESLETE